MTEPTYTNILVQPIFIKDGKKYPFEGLDKTKLCDSYHQYKFITDTLRKYFGDDLDFAIYGTNFRITELVYSEIEKMENIQDDTCETPIKYGRSQLQFEIKWQYYTFMYCMIHDDGYIIKGNHEYAPDDYIIQHSTQCTSSNWYNMGVIKYNGKNFDIIKKVRLDYDRYGGGFKFNGYCNTLTNENGESEEDSTLDNWIEEISSTNCKKQFLE